MQLWNRIARAFGVVALTLAGGCAHAETAPAQPETYAPGPALWQLSDGDTTIYLFGTIHALPPGTQWYDDRIARAFGESGELVTEIDMGGEQESGAVLAAAALLPAGQSLRTLMAPDDRAEYEAAMIALGLPPGALDPMEPWFAALNLSLLPLMQSGYDPASGVDTVLHARSTGKTLRALETINEQVALFDGLPMDAQLMLLDEAVASAPEAANILGAMVDFWLAGDADGLARLMNAEMDDPALYDRLLVARNARWVDWIAARMEQPGTVFIAVGAGHLAGAGSVQDLLGQRGYTVTRVAH